MRNFHLPGRSAVRGTQGMVASSHPLASQAGLNILRHGGNAIDAAIATAAVLAVVEPQSTGIGGDCFVLYAPAGGDILGYNGSGRTPSAASLDWYIKNGFDQIPERGSHSVTIPGAIEAWCRLHTDHGSMPLAQVLADAIHFADEGYVVADRVAYDWAQNEHWLREYPEAAKVLLPAGRAPSVGDIHRQPQLAQTLRQIAEHGSRAFYEGVIAHDMVCALRKDGGLHSISDFADHRGDYVVPISASYRGYDIFQMPPANQGLTALMMLNTLSGFDMSKLAHDGAERLHLEIEAARLAYHERDLRIGDPDFAAIPVEELLSARHALRMQRQIDCDKAATHIPESIHPHSDTAYLCVVDAQRNAVSLINSVFYEFGSGVMGPASGVILQNRARSFNLDPSHPNCIAPRKRPMHTIMPGMIACNGRAVAPLGVIGGDYQPMGQVRVITGLLDYGLDPQQALDAPRVLHEHGAVRVEEGMSMDVQEQLRQKGHSISHHADPLGGGQVIWIDWDKGTLTAGSDHRNDGCSIGY